MRNGILKTTALALGLGMATTLAYAQTDTTQKLEDKAGATATTEQKVEGQAGAAMKSGDTSAQAGAQTETEAGATAQTDAQRPQDGSDAAASGQAGAATDSTAQSDTQKQDGSDSAASGTAGAETDATAQGESGADATRDSASDQSQPSSETTASIDITAEQQTELKTVFTDVDVQPVDDVDFDISVGVAIPQTVTLHPLPPRVVEIVPVYEGYQYFVLADGRIVIVEPATFEIVYILVV